MIDLPEAQACITLVRGPLRLDDVLFQAKKACRLGPLQVVRHDRVVGTDHIAAAAIHMWRAMDEGRNQADKPEVEFTRFLSGKRTIKEALTHMGVPDGAEAGIVVGLGPERAKAVEYFVEMLGLEEGDMPAPTMEAARAFGISDDALEATTEALGLDLVLEAVAGVDLARS